MASSNEQGISKPALSALARRLTETGYTELFLRGNDTAVNSFWAAAGGQEHLRELARADDEAELARFLAAEILFQKQSDYPPDAERRTLAALYARALAENFPGMANPWGFPGFSLGPVGQHFVSLGEDAVAALTPLLDDERELAYGGSRDAMSASLYGYRVKDAAAFFVSRIRGVPFPAHESPQARDEEIAKLKHTLQ